MGESYPPIELTAHGILTAWERGSATHQLMRGCAVVGVAWQECSIEPDLLPVGACETVMLAVHVGTFGAAASALSTCPECGEDAEIDVDAAEILRSLPSPNDEAVAVEPLDLDGDPATVRLPNSLDLLQVSTSDDPRSALITRCVDAPSTLTPEQIDLVSSRITALDPAADVRLRVDCPSCGHTWSAPWWIGSFVWTEIDASARELLREVDELAGRYGWAERDILAMTPARRSAYLDIG